MKLFLKNMTFIILPDKRVLFDVNQKAAIPADFFFSSEKHSAMLKIVAEVLSRKITTMKCSQIKTHSNWSWRCTLMK